MLVHLELTFQRENIPIEKPHCYSELCQLPSTFVDQCGTKGNHQCKRQRDVRRGDTPAWQPGASPPPRTSTQPGFLSQPTPCARFQASRPSPHRHVADPTQCLLPSLRGAGPLCHSSLQAQEHSGSQQAVSCGPGIFWVTTRELTGSPPLFSGGRRKPVPSTVLQTASVVWKLREAVQKASLQLLFLCLLILSDIPHSVTQSLDI